MILSDETVVLSLLAGVGLGLIYLINQAIRSLFSIKKWGLFLLDFTFAAVCCVVTFIIALPVSGGALRFVQTGLEIIGALSVFYAFRFPAERAMQAKKVFHRANASVKRRVNKKKTTKN